MKKILTLLTILIATTLFLSACGNDIANGEEISGQFIADVYESEEYYLIQKTGAVSAGTTNQVMWTIPVSEIQ